MNRLLISAPLDVDMESKVDTAILEHRESSNNGYFIPHTHFLEVHILQRSPLQNNKVDPFCA